MSTNNDDAELEAIKQILSALSSLDGEGQHRALEYVFERLKITPPKMGQSSSSHPPLAATLVTQHVPSPQRSAGPIDIRSFTESKKPRSANEMAAVVAYYLEYEAPENEKKDTIGSEDIEKYFHLAKYAKPGNANMTLTHSKNSGYLDQQDRGQYKLNAVGYNLVVHKLPSDGEGGNRSKPVKKAKKAKAKKAK